MNGGFDDKTIVESLRQEIDKLKLQLAKVALSFYIHTLCNNNTAFIYIQNLRTGK